MCLPVEASTEGSVDALRCIMATIIWHVMHLKNDGYLVCYILDDIPPVIEGSKLYDFNIQGLTPKGLAFLSEYRDSLKR
jgi:hypothetical protein